MKKSLLFVVFGMLLLSACDRRSLEREEVILIWGMRINDAEDQTELAANLQILKEQKWNDLFIEFPLKADSLDLPWISEMPSAQNQRLLVESEIQYSLGICTTNQESLFPEGALMSPKAWFARLEVQIIELLAPLETHLPKRLVIGSDLRPSFEFSDEWKQLFSELRAQYPAVKFSIGGRSDDLKKSGLIGLSDELAIDYQPLVGENLKAQSRDRNAEIGQLALENKKDLFIFRGNIIGPDPLIQIQNRLRFWPENVFIHGICLNSLFAKIPLRDEKSYYGMKDNPDALQYLNALNSKRYE